MENASKALIISGAVLIAIMVISLGIAMFDKMKGETLEQANLDKQEIAIFNSALTPYVGESISGSQVNVLIQKVISINNNAIKNGEDNKCVTITYPVDGGTKTIDKGNINNVNIKRVATGPTSFYTVTPHYGNLGLIYEITVVEK